MNPVMVNRRQRQRGLDGSQELDVIFEALEGGLAAHGITVLASYLGRLDVAANLFERGEGR